MSLCSKTLIFQQSPSLSCVPASALLQKEEPAASRVRQLIQDAQEDGIELYISLVNLGEVYYRIGRVKGEKCLQQ